MQILENPECQNNDLRILDKMSEDTIDKGSHEPLGASEPLANVEVTKCSVDALKCVENNLALDDDQLSNNTKTETIELVNTVQDFIDTNQKLSNGFHDDKTTVNDNIDNQICNTLELNNRHSSQEIGQDSDTLNGQKCEDKGNINNCDSNMKENERKDNITDKSNNCLEITVEENERNNQSQIENNLLEEDEINKTLLKEIDEAVIDDLNVNDDLLLLEEPKTLNEDQDDFASDVNNTSSQKSECDITINHHSIKVVDKADGTSKPVISVETNDVFNQKATCENMSLVGSLHNDDQIIEPKLIDNTMEVDDEPNIIENTIIAHNDIEKDINEISTRSDILITLSEASTIIATDNSLNENVSDNNLENEDTINQKTINFNHSIDNKSDALVTLQKVDVINQTKLNEHIVAINNDSKLENAMEVDENYEVCDNRIDIPIISNINLITTSSESQDSIKEIENEKVICNSEANVCTTKKSKLATINKAMEVEEKNINKIPINDDSYIKIIRQKDDEIVEPGLKISETITNSELKHSVEVNQIVEKVVSIEDNGVISQEKETPSDVEEIDSHIINDPHLEIISILKEDEIVEPQTEMPENVTTAESKNTNVLKEKLQNVLTIEDISLILEGKDKSMDTADESITTTETVIISESKTSIEKNQSLVKVQTNKDTSLISNDLNIKAIEDIDNTSDVIDKVNCNLKADADNNLVHGDKINDAMEVEIVNINNDSNVLNNSDITSALIMEDKLDDNNISSENAKNSNNKTEDKLEENNMFLISNEKQNKVCTSMLDSNITTVNSNNKIEPTDDKNLQSSKVKVDYPTEKDICKFAELVNKDNVISKEDDISKQQLDDQIKKGNAILEKTSDFHNEKNRNNNKDNIVLEDQFSKEFMDVELLTSDLENKVSNNKDEKQSNDSNINDTFEVDNEVLDQILEDKLLSENSDCTDNVLIDDQKLISTEQLRDGKSEKSNDISKSDQSNLEIEEGTVKEIISIDVECDPKNDVVDNEEQLKDNDKCIKIINKQTISLNNVENNEIFVDISNTVSDLKDDSNTCTESNIILTPQAIECHKTALITLNDSTDNVTDKVDVSNIASDNKETIMDKTINKLEALSKTDRNTEDKNIAGDTSVIEVMDIDDEEVEAKSGTDVTSSDDLNTNSIKEKRKPISGLINNLDIISDDEEESNTAKTNKDCITVEDDDDIMLIDDESGNSKDGEKVCEKTNTQPIDEPNSKCEENKSEMENDIDKFLEIDSSISNIIELEDNNDEKTTENLPTYKGSNITSYKITSSPEESDTDSNDVICEDIIETTDDIVEDKEKKETELPPDEPKLPEKIDEAAPTIRPNILVGDDLMHSLKENITEMTRQELEEFCLYKIIEAMRAKCNFTSVKTCLTSMTLLCEEWKKKSLALSKQFRDLQFVADRLSEDLKKANTKYVAPMRITRSVGLQVFMYSSKDQEKNRKPVRKSPDPAPSTSGVTERRPSVQPGKGMELHPIRVTSDAQTIANDIRKSLDHQTSVSLKTPEPQQKIPHPRLVQPQSPKVLPKQTPPPNLTINSTKPSPVVAKRPSPSLVSKPEKRPISNSSSLTVDLTDDEPPSKLVATAKNASNGQYRLMTPPQLRSPQFGATGSPRKVYIPISGAQANVRPGQTVLFKALQSVPRMRVPPLGNVRMPQPTIARQRPNAPRHPAPLPDVSKLQLQSQKWKTLPPAPDLKIAKVENGIVISWKIEGYQEDGYEEIASYQLFAYQETAATPSTNLWKKIGDVKALPLPMACTLTQFMAGYKYYFAVRAVDIRSRIGPFSLPGSIMLINK